MLVAPKLSSKLTWCALALLLGGGSIGCGGGARSVSVATWQRNVEQYVKQRGKGDPTVLRDLTMSDSRRGFSMLGADRPAESDDANGVLLGVRQVEGQNWFIYLVGVVRKQKVDEIRLAALATDGGKMQWKLGPGDRASLDAYRQHNEKLWRGRFPDRASPPPSYLGFPRPDDTFQLSITQGQVTAAHPASGARWQLALPAPPRRT